MTGVDGGVLTVISTLVGILAAITAVVTFVISVAKARQDQRTAREDSWLEAAIHEVFQADPAELNFGAIKNSLASSAFFQSAEVGITTESLSEQRLRRLLVSLIDKGVVVQRGGDTFAVAAKRPTAQDAGAELLMRNTTLAPVILDTLARSPAGLLLVELRDRLRDDGHEIDRFQLGILLQQISDFRMAVRTDDNRWHAIN